MNQATQLFLMGMIDSTVRHINNQQADIDSMSLKNYQKIHADKTISNLMDKYASLLEKLKIQRAYAYQANYLRA